MKFVHGLAALALAFAAAPAAAAVVYSADVAPGEEAAFSWHYAAPAAGFQQTFQFTFTGLQLDSAIQNRVQYTLDRIAGGINDGFVFDESCYVLAPGDGYSSCDKRSPDYEKYPQVTFLQINTPGIVTFTIRNEPYYYDPTCKNLYQCYAEYGYSDGTGHIYGIFDAGEGGHYELIALEQTPVPEPATWTMMILGLGAIGATLRGQRRQLV